MSKHFNFEIPERMLADRQMKREQYKKIRQYLRVMARAMENMVDWRKMYKGMEKAMLYGTSFIKYEDVIKI